MTELQLPACALKTMQKEGSTYLFDILRRRYVRLTPEEWVRQHFIHYLIHHKHYPASLLANEVAIRVNGTNRRCDSVLYHPHAMQPRLIIEYKAPHVVITQDVFQQIYSYNCALRANYLIVSNGCTHYCCRIDYQTHTAEYLPDIPDYAELH